MSIRRIPNRKRLGVDLGETDPPESSSLPGSRGGMNGISEAIQALLEQFRPTIAAALKERIQAAKEGCEPGEDREGGGCGGRRGLTPADRRAIAEDQRSGKLFDYDLAMAGLRGRVDGLLMAAGMDGATSPLLSEEHLDAFLDEQHRLLADQGFTVDRKTFLREARELQAVRDAALSFRDPPEEPERERADPPEVLKYAKDGPDALQEARRLHGVYRELQDGGMRLREDLASFIESNWEK